MDKRLKLALSLVIDGIGMLLSGPLKLGDLLWAPMGALLIWKLYHRDLYMYMDFAEEILPGTEFIPTATLAWMDENGYFNFLHPQIQDKQPVERSKSNIASAFTAWKKRN